MLDLRRVFRNLSATTLMRLASALLSFALFALLARRWSTGEVGAYATILAIFTILQQAPLLGLHLVLGRDTAAKRESRRRHAVNGAAIALASSIVIAALVAVVGRAIYPPSMHPALALMALSLVPTALIVVEESILWGEERMATVMAVNLFENGVRVAGSAILLFLGYGLTAVWACFLAGRFVSLAAYWFGAGLRDAFSLSDLDSAMIRRYLWMSPTFAGILAASASINRIDFLLLSKLGRLEDVGYYAAAYRINEIALMAPITLSVVLFPVFSRVHAASEAQFASLLRGVLRLEFIVGMPLALLIVILAQPLLTLLFGAGYAASTPVLRLLIFVPVLAGLDQALTSVQLVHARQGDDLRVLGGAALAYVVLLLVLIPRYGSIGAAIATLATGFLQLAMRYGSTRRAGIVPPLTGLLVRPVLAALIMCGVMALTAELGDAARIVAPLAAYVAALWAFGAVTRADLSRFASGFTVAPGAGT